MSLLEMGNAVAALHPQRAVGRLQEEVNVVARGLLHFLKATNARAVIAQQSGLRTHPQKSLTILGQGGDGGGAESKTFAKMLDCITRV